MTRAPIHANNVGHTRAATGRASPLPDKVLLAAYRQCQTNDAFVLKIPEGLVPTSNNGAVLRTCF